MRATAGLRVALLVTLFMAPTGPGVASAAGPWGTYRLVDPVQRPPQFTVRLVRSSAACRRLAGTRGPCFTLRQRGGDELLGSGRVIFSGRRLTFRDSVTGACPGQDGAYTWRHAAHGLRVRAGDDECSGRRHLFVVGVWSRA